MECQREEDGRRDGGAVGEVRLMASLSLHPDQQIPDFKKARIEIARVSTWSLERIITVASMCSRRPSPWILKAVRGIIDIEDCTWVDVLGNSAAADLNT
jgi:hypothetical protein